MRLGDPLPEGVSEDEIYRPGQDDYPLTEEEQAEIDRELAEFKNGRH